MRAKPALQTYIESVVGGGFNVVPTTITLSTTAQKVLSNNFERMAAVMVNTGSQSAAVLPSPNVTATNGILLAANGGNVSMNAQQDLAVVGWEWWAVAVTGTPTLTVFEIVRVSGDPAPST